MPDPTVRKSRSDDVFASPSSIPLRSRYTAPGFGASRGGRDAAHHPGRDCPSGSGARSGPRTCCPRELPGLVRAAKLLELPRPEHAVGDRGHLLRITPGALELE